jgi:hypothetical protein
MSMINSGICKNCSRKREELFPVFVEGHTKAGTGYFAVIVFPGPIIGVFLGLAVIGMGIVKSIRTGMAIKTTATR